MATPEFLFRTTGLNTLMTWREIYMRNLTALLTLGLVLALGGCVPSLHPLYTDNDVVFDAALLGQWVSTERDSKETLTFTKGDKNAYKLVQIDDSSKGVYIAHLIKLDGKLFLDVKPDPDAKCECVCAPFHMSFFVSQIQPTLRIRDLDDKWLEAFLKKNPSALGHEFVGEDLWLTAPPKQLQSFVLKHLNTKGAFADPEDYVRKE